MIEIGALVHDFRWLGGQQLQKSTISQVNRFSTSASRLSTLAVCLGEQRVKGTGLLIRTFDIFTHIAEQYQPTNVT